MLRRAMGLLMLGLSATALPAQDAPRFDAASLMLPPIEPTRISVDSDLPPRAATMRLRREEAAAPTVRAEQIHQVGGETRRPAERDLTGEELFDYLADVRKERRETGRNRRPADDDRTSRRDPRYDAPADAAGSSDDWYFGKRLGGLFHGDGVKKEREGWFFCSDHEFESMISPVTNPFLFEDPRALSEVRPIFIYQKVPNAQPNFQGGDIWFAGGQARIAFTQQFSITINKLGAVGVNPKSSLLPDGTGLSELWFGPKYTFYRDDQAGRVAAAGVQFQVPLGNAKVAQDTGDLTIVPYVSFGQTFLKSPIGTFNALGTTGYAFSINNKRSDYFYASGHLSLDVADKQKFFPLVELNWFQYSSNGTSRFIKGEGTDLVNFGSLAKGSGLLTCAVGARYRFTRHIEMGAAYEFPLSGNRDFFNQRATVDLIFRY